MLVIYFLRIRRLPLSNQLVILVVSFVLLPPTSYDYTLAHLYTCWAVIVVLVAKQTRIHPATKTLVAVLVLFAGLMTPSNIFSWRFTDNNGLFKCLLLIALLVISIVSPFEGESERFDEVKPSSGSQASALA